MALATFAGMTAPLLPGFAIVSIWIVSATGIPICPSSCECDCLRGTPAVPVDNDCRFPLFVGRENPITVRVEHPDHLMKSLPSMVVPKHYSFDEWVAMAKVGGELYLRVLRIVLADKAPNKPNNDHLPTGGPGRREMNPRDRDLRG